MLIIEFPGFEIKKNLMKILINADLLEFILKSKLEDTQLNIIIILQMFLTIAVSYSSCERSISKLKWIKNYLRSTMNSLSLTNLAIAILSFK